MEKMKKRDSEVQKGSKYMIRQSALFLGQIENKTKE
jgi:hypothetical protein